MNYVTPGWKTTEFWSHVAISAAALAATLGTVFDKAFVASHPALSAGVTIASIVLAGLSQAAYSISRGIAKSGGETPPVAAQG